MSRTGGTEWAICRSTRRTPLPSSYGIAQYWVRHVPRVNMRAYAAQHEERSEHTQDPAAPDNRDDNNDKDDKRVKDGND